MKSRKAPGIDSIMADLLRLDTDTTIQVLHELFNKIWEEESGLIIKLPKKGDLTSCENWKRYHPHVHCGQGVGKSPD